MEGNIPNIIHIMQEEIENPVSLHEIQERLWLGNLTAASDIKVINEHKITHIITLDLVPLRRQITELSELTTKFVQIADVPKEDILSHFEDCYNFIDNCLQENGTVLVHCYYGMSRSATIVIAYVMKKNNMPFDEAFELVKSKRKFVHPNHGFQHQLKLYEKMGYIIDKNYPKFRDFRLKIAADQVKKVKILPQTSIDLIKPDPGVVQVKPEPLVYRCKKCRRIVASQSNIITHLDREAQINHKLKEKHRIRHLTAEELAAENEEIEICRKTYFIEPLAWMKDICQNTQGKLYCPKCNNKIGSFSWIMGCQCPCGSKVSPAFYLVPSKVEWSNVVQNVQVTV
ncbi:dual specificity protein phosphatase MPK-4-like isoform X2 [Chrysoperla carnea]|uniref:dual specificity protein phosphatase MPK-4-like isoform X2 n=1 Tax=Chrysoperla carnea TaxID=189513 RepID=UPI001D07C6A9|nr:dual specificity protein phosphatase MPK-4-like isoform X2 [Chrysoperla carnea]